MAPNQKRRIDKVAVNSLFPPESTDYVVWDTQIAGFGLKITPSNTRTYFFSYRTLGGQQRKIKIGRSNIITPDDARKKAEGFRAAVNEGIDPQADKKKTKREAIAEAAAATSVADAMEAWLVVKMTEVKPKTFDDYNRNSRNHIIPQLGKMLVNEVTKSDIESMRNTAGHPNRISGICVEIANAFFAWALENGSRKIELGNPCKGVAWSKSKKRRVYLNTDETHIFLKAIADVTADHIKKNRPVQARAGLVIKLQILTGARRGEILNLRHRMIDSSRNIATLEDHKTATQTDDDFVREIHFQDAAMEVIDQLIEMRHVKILPHSDDDLVAEGENGNVMGKTTHYKVWRQVLDNAHKNGFTKKDIHPHDLRHSFASAAVKEGASLQMIALLLGHEYEGTSHRYAHIMEEDAAAMASKIGNRFVPKKTKRKKPR